MKYLVILLAVFMVGSVSAEPCSFTRHPDLAQYGESDYMNVVRVERGISLEEAFDIAEGDSEIDYFVYLKGGQMVLCTAPGVKFDEINDPFGLVIHSGFIYDSGAYGRGNIRVFRHGDTVFFKKDGMWLGSAPGLADVYIKQNNL